MIFRSLSAAGFLLALAVTQGYAEPISANHQMLSSPRIGLSTKEDVIRLWGKPAKEHMEHGNNICTWNRGRETVTLRFSKMGVLADRKVHKH